MDSQSWLLLHGAGGGGWEWVVWQRVLRARGLAVAAPNLAPAPGGLAATVLEDYTQQAVAAARAAGAVPVVVGASLGGLLAAQVAAALPVRALVLINPLPPAPWHGLLPTRAASPPIIPWGREASLASTRRALPDAMDATCAWAWQRWRDESGAVVDAARAGVGVGRPACPVLVIASEADDEVPVAASAALAHAWSASLWRLPGASHVGPLLGRSAAGCAEQSLRWVDALG